MKGHDSAHLHVRGESTFIDDLPQVANEVFVEIVTAPYAHAQIERLDLSRARKHPEVLGVFTAEDLKHNLWGSIVKDQPLLAKETCNYFGEPLALIAATSREAAKEARNLVRIKARPQKAILSIGDAKKSASFIGPARTIARGEVERALRAAPHRLSGKLIIRGAEHFYLENQAALAIPKEDGQIEVYCSSQHPTEVQHVVADALELDSSQIKVEVKRMGGAFGGKESQAAPFAAFAALVAQRLHRPARLVLSKDDDMIITGKRNPFENDYQVGFSQDGLILGVDISMFSDGGAYADLSPAIMERAMLHADNAYFVQAMRVTGQVCRTNYHPHTAFRGFGAPKGVATIERIIEEIAHFLGKDPLEIRLLNCYASEQDRNITHYGQTFDDNNLPAILRQLADESDYLKRRQAIRTANATGQASVLRGISLTPIKFGISFTTRFLNQANALVHLHRDGSIQVSTGATEMGQGVNARISDLVGSEFGVPRSSIRVLSTSTERNANTSPTAASSGTDLNGAAAVLACRKIKQRLSLLAKHLLNTPVEYWPSRTAGLGSRPEFELSGLPDIEENALSQESCYFAIRFLDGRVFAQDTPERFVAFRDLVNEAYLSRQSLSEMYHYKFPYLSFNKQKGEGRAFLYFTQGAAVSEVEIDRDSGLCKVRRVDILMDLGRPIDEPLDLGQIQGAFVQGMGWMTSEKLHYKDGQLLSHSPSTYKIPSIQDTPREFHVRFFANDRNKVNVRATKAVGEPPLLLAISVWTAIHDALSSLPEYQEHLPTLEIPASCEQVLRKIHPGAFARWEAQT